MTPRPPSGRRRAVNVTPGTVAIDAAAGVQHQRARAGYMDGRRQQPYAEQFDLWSTEEQLAYETGRLWSANMRAAGIKFPSWPGRRQPPPLPVREAAREAAVRCGDSAPGEALPDSRVSVQLEPGSLPIRRRRRRA